MNRLADMTTTTGLRLEGRLGPWETSYSKVGARERLVEGPPVEFRRALAATHSMISAPLRIIRRENARGELVCKETGRTIE